MCMAAVPVDHFPTVKAYSAVYCDYIVDFLFPDIYSGDGAHGGRSWDIYIFVVVSDF